MLRCRRALAPLPDAPARSALQPPLPSTPRPPQYGVRHYEMYFPDGTCPSEQILLRFLETAEREPGALAVSGAAQPAWEVAA